MAGRLSGWWVRRRPERCPASQRRALAPHGCE